MRSLRGQFLIASPKLPDPNFCQSVVLMLEHHDQGALGLILNRPTDVTLKEVWEQVEKDSCDCQTVVSLGGPVQGPLVALHHNPLYSESEVVPGVHVATERSNIRGLIYSDKEHFRVFTGYAGWGAGQLESELDMGGWISMKASAELVFIDDLGLLWQRVLKLSGKEFMRDTLGIQAFPDDPQLN